MERPANSSGHEGLRWRPPARGQRALQAAAVALPLLFVFTPLGDPTDALRRLPVPPPHSVDVWGNHTDGLDFDVVGARKAIDQQLHRQLAQLGQPAAPLEKALASEPTGGTGQFLMVGSVAVTVGDDATVLRQDTGFGITAGNLAALSTRFIQTFGDDYDQLAVFLAFPDRLSMAALAYQQPVKNDVVGIGLGLFDRTKEFGSPSGRMQTVLNMKRISLYGRDAAGDPDNGLYPVWAQEAAHRWLVYYRYKFKPEDMLSEALLGRQKAHWASGVETQGSIMDGYDWKDNGDGTFTPGRRSFRYGILDQYGMGLRKAEEVPPFFILTDLKSENGTPATALGAAGRYTATKVMITVQDIIRGSGPRTPMEDAAAQDLRMAVLLLGAPGTDVGQLVGEAFQIDNTRQQWTDFYNEAGGGRGRVCTELLRPCRENAFTFSEISIDEAAVGANKDGVLAPGEPFVLSAKLTNVGANTVQPEISVSAPGLVFDRAVEGVAKMKAPRQLASNEEARITFTGRVGTMSCDAATTVDLRTNGARGGSRALADVVVGIHPKQVEDFDGAGVPDGWRVNPDGNDSGQSGRWAWGTPARSEAFNYTLQPGAPYSGTGAFVTGLSKEQSDSVDGRTTLESPELALAGLRRPVLSYAVYFVAAEFAQEVLVPTSVGVLRTLASTDGTSWVEVDRQTGMATGWRRRLVPLADKLGDAFKSAQKVRLRFVAEKNSQVAGRVVEVALDEVGLYEQSETCGMVLPAQPPAQGGDSGGGCAVGGRPPAGGWLAGGAGLALLLGRRRGRRS